MRLRVVMLVSLLVVMLVAACQGPPPTLIVLVVTSTPDATLAPTIEPSPLPPTETVTPESQTTQATPNAQTANTTPAVLATPTTTIAQIQVAEQPFQRGHMYWLQPIDQIWVLVETGEGFGTWTVHEDTFEEGMVEFDPTIVAPENLLQPERGFGGLWRDNKEVREAIGWALEPEFGYVANYEYQPGGEFVDGVWQNAPGYHIVTNQYGDVYRFNEVNGTWQLIPNPKPNGTPEK